MTSYKNIVLSFVVVGLLQTTQIFSSEKTAANTQVEYLQRKVAFLEHQLEKLRSKKSSCSSCKYHKRHSKEKYSGYSNETDLSVIHYEMVTGKRYR